MLQWLSPLVVLRGQSTFPINALMGLGRNDLRARLYVGHAVLGVLLFAALIPTYLWRGALAATLVTELSLCVSGWAALLWCERNRLPSRGSSPAIS
jgi:O-antigen/teichoic acid export membrane protein